MPRSSSRGKNNNPTGRNQYTNDWMDTVKERPIATAAVAAASVGAGVFLWSKRNMISNQLSNLSDQIGEWTENMRSVDRQKEPEMAGSESSPSGAATGSSSARTSRSTGSRRTSTAGSGNGAGS